MWLKKIHFKNFRNFREKDVFFHPFLTIIYGDNARGKTNLLEGVFCLSLGEGFREKKEKELLMINKNYCKLEGFFEDKETTFRKAIVFQNINGVFKKEYLIDGVKKNLSVFRKSFLRAILFSPNQLEILTGSPEARREYFDKVLSFDDPNYKKSLTNYFNALKKRNKILEETVDSKVDKELVFWNKYLEIQGQYLSQKREEYINFINSNSFLDNKHFFIEYRKDLFTQERIFEFSEKEKIYKKTFIGPQKDDFIFYLVENNFKKNIHIYGSRSEQRLAIIWLKINEILFYEEFHKKKPLLLLDDVFSELDYNNERLVLKLIKNYQTIITTTQPEILSLVEFPKSIIKL